MNSTLRARGFVTGGQYNGSTWFVETTLQIVPPAILVNDDRFGMRSNNFGFNTRAVPGQIVVIEAVTNLVTWTPVQTNLVTSASTRAVVQTLAFIGHTGVEPVAWINP